jgi:predicted GNAT superfamily acetyltransferase
VNYVVRPCLSREEFAACVELQQRIWGYADSETYPLRFFVNLHRNAGQVLGAFTFRNRMVAFLAAMPAWRDGRRYLYSLALGVLPEHENRGLGRALKLAQRRAALREGIEWIEWTFDPLQAKNAFFNFERLGALARRYEADYYGPIGSRLQQGRPTDRLICEWWLKSRRVKRAIRGLPVHAQAWRTAAEVAIPGNFLLSPRRIAARRSPHRCACGGKFRTICGTGLSLRASGAKGKSGNICSNRRAGRTFRAGRGR